MLKCIDLTQYDDRNYDYDFVADGNEGASIWVAGPDGKRWINVVIQIAKEGVEVRLWPMDEFENLTEWPVGTIHLDFAEVEALRGGRQ